MIDQTRRARIEPKRGALAVDEAEGDLGLCQSEPLHHVGNGGALDALRLHEFQPRRRRVEQIAHLDARAAASAAGLSFDLLPASTAIS